MSSSSPIPVVPQEIQSVESPVEQSSAVQVAEVAAYSIDLNPAVAAQPVVVTILHDDSIASASGQISTLPENVAVHVVPSDNHLVSESTNEQERSAHEPDATGDAAESSADAHDSHASPQMHAENTSEFVTVTEEGPDNSAANSAANSPAAPLEESVQDAESSASHQEQTSLKCSCCHKVDAVFRVFPCEHEYCQNCIGLSSRCIACGALITTVEHL